MSIYKSIAIAAGVFIAYTFFVLFIASYVSSILPNLTSIVRAIACLYLLYKYNPFGSSGGGNMEVFLAAGIIFFTQTINTLILSHMTSIQGLMQSYY